jgi:hypothetical protein
MPIDSAAMTRILPTKAVREIVRLPVFISLLVFHLDRQRCNRTPIINRVGENPPAIYRSGKFVRTFDLRIDLKATRSILDPGTRGITILNNN